MINTETIEKAKSYIKFKAGYLKQPNGKWKMVQALRLQRKIARSLKRQSEWIANEAQSLSFFNNKSKVQVIKRKDSKKEIGDMLDKMPENENIAGAVANGAKTSYVKGAKTAYDLFDMGAVNIDFSLINHDAVDYLKAKETLHLSDYKGSIKRTTKRRIAEILTNAAESGQSYQDTAREIRQQAVEGVFSQDRAEMIATNEIGTAYGEGNHEMVDQYRQETGAEIQKYWITVQDDRVTEECAANEAMGWITYHEHFNSGDDIAPRSSNPRCRCDTGYRRVDSQGNEV